MELFIYESGVLKSEMTLFPKDTIAFEMPFLKSIDIDDEEDFLLAEYIAKMGL